MENTSSWAFCVNAFYPFHIVLGEICFSCLALTHTLLVFLVSVPPLSWSAPVQYRPAIHSVCRRVGKHPGFVPCPKSLSQFLCLCASLFLNNTSKISKPFPTYWPSRNRPWAKGDPRAVLCWRLPLGAAGYFRPRPRTDDITPSNGRCPVLLQFLVLSSTTFLWTFHVTFHVVNFLLPVSLHSFKLRALSLAVTNGQTHTCPRMHMSTHIHTRPVHTRMHCIPLFATLSRGSPLTPSVI